MSVDFDAYPDRSPPQVTSWVPQPTDLEVIVTMLEIAALNLTPDPSATFTFDDLLAEANRMGGSEIVFDARDVAIVVPGCKFLKPVPGGRYRLE
jgi:hypothetical protein